MRTILYPSTYMEAMEEQLGIQISYTQHVPLSKTIRFSGTTYSVQYVLEHLLEGTDILIIEKNGKLFLQKKNPEKKHSISGYIKDARTGETLVGAAVYIPGMGLGVISNAYGFYSFTLPEDRYPFQWSYVGYENAQKTISLTKDITHLMNQVLQYGRKPKTPIHYPDASNQIFSS